VATQRIRKRRAPKIEEVTEPSAPTPAGAASGAGPSTARSAGAQASAPGKAGSASAASGASGLKGAGAAGALPPPHVPAALLESHAVRARTPTRTHIHTAHVCPCASPGFTLTAVKSCRTRVPTHAPAATIDVFECSGFESSIRECATHASTSRPFSDDRVGDPRGLTAVCAVCALCRGF
jgi:hypothetical protein